MAQQCGGKKINLSLSIMVVEPLVRKMIHCLCLKKKFSQNTEFPFYVGKKVWNKNVYDILCQKANITEQSDFFPLYRLKKDENKSK